MRTKMTALLAGAVLLGSSVALAQDEDSWAKAPEATAREAAPAVEPGAPRTVTATATATASTAGSATASTTKRLKKKRGPRSWEESARFFVGARGGVAVPAGATGIAPLGGIEIGVAADQGLGIGLHFITMDNPPDAPALGIGKANWGIGALADFRWYFQTVRPLTLYPTFSVGFAAGPGADGRNVVLPMVNPGFGARVRLGSLYVAFEFGAAAFTIPFVNVAVGFEPPRPPPEAEEEEEV